MTKVKNERVSQAVSRAMKQRAITHKEAARRLGLAIPTVNNTVCSGNFNQEKAEKWSQALDIPVEVFLNGDAPLPPNEYHAIMNELARIRKEIDDLRKTVNRLSTDKI